jgi:hypothetical protein
MSADLDLHCVSAIRMPSMHGVANDAAPKELQNKLGTPEHVSAPATQHIATARSTSR